MSYAVPSPKIAEIIDLHSGELLQAAALIGEDYARAIQLRMAIQEALLRGLPLYACPICSVPVTLAGRRETRRFFFRHTIEDGSCPAITRGELSRDEINARRYNGIKESALHRTMKAWVVQCMQLDSQFSDIAAEQTIVSRVTGELRRPDVSAKFNGRPVVVEIQLSTTYLDVIAARRHFYQKQGTALLWVFADFTLTRRRLTQDDVFFNNNQNAFIVNENTVDASRAAGKFMIECRYARPETATDELDLIQETVAFDALTFDLALNRIFFMISIRQSESKPESPAQTVTDSGKLSKHSGGRRVIPGMCQTRHGGRSKRLRGGFRSTCRLISRTFHELCWTRFIPQNPALRLAGAIRRCWKRRTGLRLRGKRFFSFICAH